MTEATQLTGQEPAKKTLFIGLRAKMILALAVLFLVAFASIFYWLDGFVFNLAMKNLRTDLLATAETAAAGIDGDAHQALFESGIIDDTTYTKVADYLRLLKQTNPKASGMYTYVQLPDKPEQVQLVVSAALPPGSAEQASAQSASSAGCIITPGSRPELGQDYTDISPTMVAGLHTAGAETVLWADEWGSWLSGYAPIYNSKGEAVGAVGVDMCAQEVIDLQRNIRSNMSIATAITLVVLIIVVWLIATGVTSPVMELTRIADLIGGGDYQQNFEKLYASQVQDEVNKLASVFELMVDKVYAREQKLIARVEQLEIMIDESKRDTQVKEIVDSDFFQDLQTKVQTMRGRFKSGGAGGSSEDTEAE